MHGELREVCVPTDEDVLCVAILQIGGDIDIASYQGLIEQARTLYAHGQRMLLLDLRNVSQLGIAGLFAVQSIVALYRGEEPPDPDSGWGGLKRVMSEADAQPTGVRLFNACPGVKELLMRAALPVYDDLLAALRAL